MWTLPGQCLDQTLPRRRSFSETHNHINALGITVSLMLLGYVNHITLNVTVVHLVNETQKFFSTNFILIRQYWSNLSYGSNVMFKTAKDECQFNSIPWTSPWRMSPKVNPSCERHNVHAWMIQIVCDIHGIHRLKHRKLPLRWTSQYRYSSYATIAVVWIYPSMNKIHSAECPSSRTDWIRFIGGYVR